MPVPADGDCTKTLGHLDPYIRGDKPPCDFNIPQSCQVGDLAGKYGKITTDPFEASYVDYFASTVDGLGSFFGNRSIVLHLANSTRITCANFVKASPGGSGATHTRSAADSQLPTGTRTSNSSNNTAGPTSPSAATATNSSATAQRVAGWGLMGALVAAMMLAL